MPRKVFLKVLVGAWFINWSLWSPLAFFLGRISQFFLYWSVESLFNLSLARIYSILCNGCHGRFSHKTVSLSGEKCFHWHFCLFPLRTTYIPTSSPKPLFFQNLLIHGRCSRSTSWITLTFRWSVESLHNVNGNLLINYLCANHWNPSPACRLSQCESTSSLPLVRRYFSDRFQRRPESLCPYVFGLTDST